MGLNFLLQWIISPLYFLQQLFYNPISLENQMGFSLQIFQTLLWFLLTILAIHQITSVSNGTKVIVIPFNRSVQVVLQDTSNLGTESHPFHLHVYNVFVVGQGFGNFDYNKDPAKFNLVDPVERNTVAVPSGRWVAIRFFADNPGMYLSL